MNTSQKMEYLNRLYKEADKVLTSIIIETAVQIMKENPELIEYCQGMGVWFFEDVGGRTFSYNECNRIEPMTKIMEDWSESFHCTGNPMRVKPDGSVITNW